MHSAFGVDHGEVSKGLGSAVKGAARAIKGKPYAGGVPTIRQVVGLSMPTRGMPSTRVPRTQMGRNFQMKRLNRKLGPMS